METPVVVKEPEKVKKVKEVKPPRFGKGWTAETWAAHLATMQRQELPAGYIQMSELCKKATEVGIKATRLVTAMGGDRAADKPWDPIFQVIYVGGRKYGSPEILTKGFAMLNDPNFHPVTRKPREKKAKEIVVNAVETPVVEAPPPAENKKFTFGKKQ